MNASFRLSTALNALLLLLAKLPEAVVPHSVESLRGVAIDVRKPVAEIDDFDVDASFPGLAPKQQVSEVRLLGSAVATWR